MNTFIISTTTALGLALALQFAAPASAETDACAGQTWPNQSDACIKQIVKAVCEAGGGTNCSGGDAQTVDKRTYEAYLALPSTKAPTRKN